MLCTKNPLTNKVSMGLAWLSVEDISTISTIIKSTEVLCTLICLKNILLQQSGNGTLSQIKAVAAN